MIINQVQAPYFESLKRDFWLSALQILGASFFIALCAQISIPLYFTPVPLSGQTFSVMLIGATLGSRKGALSVLAYILEGVLGLPVFTAGQFGLMMLISPVGGYIVGFVLQAYLIGWFVERQAKFESFKTVVVLFGACALQMGIGAIWLSLFVGFGQALAMGIYPFIIGETIKILGLSAYLKRTSA